MSGIGALNLGVASWQSVQLLLTTLATSHGTLPLWVLALLLDGLLDLLGVLLGLEPQPDAKTNKDSTHPTARALVTMPTLTA
jgi:hypothetical protein